VTTHIGADPALLVGIDEQLLAVEARADAQPFESEQGAPQVVAPDTFDGDVAVGDRRKADEAGDLDVVGADTVGDPVQGAAPSIT